MVQNQTTNFRNFAAQLLLGSIALAPVTLAFFRLDVDLALIAVAYLIVIVVLSLLGSFIALIRNLRDGETQWREFFHKADRLISAFFTKKSSAMDMGLSICRSIMEAHGGRLSAFGNGETAATLQFVLPLHQEDAP